MNNHIENLEYLILKYEEYPNKNMLDVEEIMKDIKNEIHEMKSIILEEKELERQLRQYHGPPLDFSMGVSFNHRRDL